MSTRPPYPGTPPPSGAPPNVVPRYSGPQGGPGGPMRYPPQSYPVSFMFSTTLVSLTLSRLISLFEKNYWKLNR